MAHASEIAGRSGDEVDFRVQSLELVLKNNHREDGGACGDIAGTYAHGVGGDHASARVTFRRREDNARLEGSGRVEQLGAFGG